MVELLKTKWKAVLFVFVLAGSAGVANLFGLGNLADFLTDKQGEVASTVSPTTVVE